MSRTERQRVAESILAQQGLRAVVRSAGQEGEVAVVELAQGRLTELQRHAEALRALGYRYIAADVTPAPDRGPTEQDPPA